RVWSPSDSMNQTLSAYADIFDQLTPAYRLIAGRWLNWLEGRGATAEMATEYLVKEYFESLRGQHCPSTIRKELSVIRIFYRRLQTEGRLARSPAQQVHFSLHGYESRSRTLPSETTIECIKGVSMISVRDRAVMRLRASGLSISQLVRLDMTD